MTHFAVSSPNFAFAILLDDSVPPPPPCPQLLSTPRRFVLPAAAQKPIWDQFTDNPPTFKLGPFFPKADRPVERHGGGDGVLVHAGRVADSSDHIFRRLLLTFVVNKLGSAEVRARLNKLLIHWRISPYFFSFSKGIFDGCFSTYGRASLYWS